MEKPSRWLLKRIGGEQKTMPILLKDGVNTIGRGMDSSIVCRSIFLSRHHCEITIRDGEVFIKDRGSFNGTFIENKRLDSERNIELKDGEIISFGKGYIKGSTPGHDHYVYELVACSLAERANIRPKRRSCSSPPHQEPHQAKRPRETSPNSELSSQVSSTTTTSQAVTYIDLTDENPPNIKLEPDYEEDIVEQGHNVNEDNTRNRTNERSLAEDFTSRKSIDESIQPLASSTINIVSINKEVKSGVCLEETDFEKLVDILGVKIPASKAMTAFQTLINFKTQGKSRETVSNGEVSNVALHQQSLPAEGTSKPSCSFTDSSESRMFSVSNSTNIYTIKSKEDPTSKNKGVIHVKRNETSNQQSKDSYSNTKTVFCESSSMSSERCSRSFNTKARENLSMPSVASTSKEGNQLPVASSSITSKVVRPEITNTDQHSANTPMSIQDSVNANQCLINSQNSEVQSTRPLSNNKHNSSRPNKDPTLSNLVEGFPNSPLRDINEGRIDKGQLPTQEKDPVINCENNIKENILELPSNKPPIEIKEDILNTHSGITSVSCAYEESNESSHLPATEKSNDSSHLPANEVHTIQRQLGTMLPFTEYKSDAYSGNPTFLGGSNDVHNVSACKENRKLKSSISCSNKNETSNNNRGIYPIYPDDKLIRNTVDEILNDINVDQENIPSQSKTNSYSNKCYVNKNRSREECNPLSPNKMNTPTESNWLSSSSKSQAADSTPQSPSHSNITNFQSLHDASSRNQQIHIGSVFSLSVNKNGEDSVQPLLNDNGIFENDIHTANVPTCLLSPKSPSELNSSLPKNSSDKKELQLDATPSDSTRPECIENIHENSFISFANTANNFNASTPIQNIIKVGKGVIRKGAKRLKLGAAKTPNNKTSETQNSGIIKDARIHHNKSPEEGFYGFNETDNSKEKNRIYSLRNYNNNNKDSLIPSLENQSSSFVQKPVDLINNQPVDLINNQPVDSINNDLVDSIHNQPADSINNQSVDSINNLPVDSINNQPVDLINNKTVDLINNEPVKYDNVKQANKSSKMSPVCPLPPTKEQLSIESPTEVSPPIKIQDKDNSSTNIPELAVRSGSSSIKTLNKRNQRSRGSFDSSDVYKLLNDLEKNSDDILPAFCKVRPFPELKYEYNEDYNNIEKQLRNVVGEPSQEIVKGIDPNIEIIEIDDDEAEVSFSQGVDSIIEIDEDDDSYSQMLMENKPEVEDLDIKPQLMCSTMIKEEMDDVHEIPGLELFESHFSQCSQDLEDQPKSPEYPYDGDDVEGNFPKNNKSCANKNLLERNQVSTENRENIAENVLETNETNLGLTLLKDSNRQHKGKITEKSIIVTRDSFKKGSKKNIKSRRITSDEEDNISEEPVSSPPHTRTKCAESENKNVISNNKSILSSSGVHDIDSVKPFKKSPVVTEAISATEGQSTKVTDVQNNKGLTGVKLVKSTLFSEPPGKKKRRGRPPKEETSFTKQVLLKRKQEEIKVQRTAKLKSLALQEKAGEWADVGTNSNQAKTTNNKLLPISEDEVASRALQSDPVDTNAFKVAKMTERNRSTILLEGFLEKKPDPKKSRGRPKRSPAINDSLELVGRTGSSRKPEDKCANLESGVPRRKSCLKGLNSGSAKKKVTFVSEPSIKFYECDGTLSRAVSDSISKDKDVKSSVSTPARFTPDEFIMNILHWNTSWRKESLKVKGDPPVYKEVVKTKDTFISYSDYKRWAYPLLFYELWANMMKKMDEVEALKSGRLFKGVIIMKEMRKTSPALMTLKCCVPIMSREVPTLIDPMDLLLLFVSTDDKKILVMFGIVMSQIKILSVRDTTDPYARSYLACIDYRAEMCAFFDVVIYNSCNRPVNTGNHIKIHPNYNINYETRQFESLVKLRSSPLLDIIIDPEKNSEVFLSTCMTDSIVSSQPLNEEQARSVKCAAHTVFMNKPSISLIHGPPGTGKTRVIVNIVEQVLYRFKGKTGRKQRILLCSQTNTAIDEICSRLLDIRRQLPREKRFKLCRFGRKDKVNPKVQDILSTTIAQKEVEKMNLNEVLAIELSLLKAQERMVSFALEETRNRRPADVNNDHRRYDYIQGQISNLERIVNNTAKPEALKKEIDRLVADEELKIIYHSDIIATTLGSCVSKRLGRGLNLDSHSKEDRGEIGLCIIDEASQATEASTLIPLLHDIKHLILVGDPQQLPPMVNSETCKKSGMQQSLFSRLYKVWSNMNGSHQSNSTVPLYKLKMQFRMHPEIAKFPSLQFYKNELTSPDYLSINRGYKAYSVLTHRHQSGESDNNETNLKEAELTVNLIHEMLEQNVFKSNSIGVIVPYQKQKMLIVDLMKERQWLRLVTVNTIDSYQGQEKDIIILTCVRTNGTGFLSDHQRTNVAITRAKRCLIIIANFSSIQSDHVWKNILSDAQSRKLHLDIKNKTTAKDAIDFIVDKQHRRRDKR